MILGLRIGKRVFPEGIVGPDGLVAVFRTGQLIVGKKLAAQDPVMEDIAEIGADLMDIFRGCRYNRGSGGRG